MWKYYIRRGDGVASLKNGVGEKGRVGLCGGMMSNGENFGQDGHQETKNLGQREHVNACIVSSKPTRPNH